MADSSETPGMLAQPPKVKRAYGRSLSDFSGLTPAEERLIDACQKGETCVLSASRPKRASGKTRIRAGLVRFLALGGDEAAPVHEKGVMLEGAWLDGVLDLGDCDVIRPIILRNCRLDAVEADDARLPGLGIENSRLEHGFNGYRLNCRGILSLSGKDFTAGTAVGLARAEIGELHCDDGQFEGSIPDATDEEKPERLALDLSGATIRGQVGLAGTFRATGAVRLADTSIGGNLVCSGARFDNPGGDALLAIRMKVAGDVYLHNNFHATGAVRLGGASIGGVLDWSGGTFENAEGTALQCQFARIEGSLFARDLSSAKGRVDLSAMYVGVLIDDAECWGRVGGDLLLDGLCYNRIVGTGAPTSSTARIKWLKQQQSSHLTSEFRPQPWEQVISVLRTMGHPGEARLVAIEKRRYMLAAARGRLSKRPSLSRNFLAEAYHWLADRVGLGLSRLYDVLIGFGYAPTRLFLVMIVLWFLFAAGFQWASSPGQGPLSPACSLFVAAKDFGAGILPAAGAATAPGAAPTAGQAASCAQTGSFNPWLYSLDTLLPIDLSYQPSFKPVDSGWGNVVRWMIVLETTFGWLGIGLLIAAFTSLIKKD